MTLTLIRIYALTLICITIMLGLPAHAQGAKAVSMQIFYATDRQREGGNINPKYTKKRRYASGMEYGQCNVTLPANVDLRKNYGLGWRAGNTINGKAIVATQKDQAKDPESFFDQLKERYDKSKSDRIIIFIHGYNNGMDVALLRAAELALEFRAPAVAYSWPSNESLPAYVKDECNAEWSLPHFRRLLDELEKEFGAEHITIVAHSMGNRLLMWALNARAEKAEATKSELRRFPDIVFTSPDIDSGTFRNYVEKIAKNADETWLLISSKDRALSASSFLHGRNRLGRSSEDGVDTDWRQPPKIDTLKTIEFTLLDKGLIGHSVQPKLIARVALDGIEKAGVKLKEEKSPDGKYAWYRVVK